MLESIHSNLQLSHRLGSQEPPPILNLQKSDNEAALLRITYIRLSFDIGPGHALDN